MLKVKLMAGILVGAVAFVSMASPALAKDPNGYAANQMAMQMWMNQQANNQQNAAYAQQQANDNYNAAQYAWATRTVPPANSNGYYGNNNRRSAYGRYSGNAYGGERWGHYHPHDGH